jgi:hypothetical protein
MWKNARGCLVEILKTFILLAMIGGVFVIHAIRETRPKSFEINRVAVKRGWKGTLGTTLFAVMNASGNVEVVEFRDYGLVTTANVKIAGKSMQFVGLPISGKFYRVDSDEVAKP